MRRNSLLILTIVLLLVGSTGEDSAQAGDDELVVLHFEFDSATLRIEHAGEHREITLGAIDLAERLADFRRRLALNDSRSTGASTPDGGAEESSPVPAAPPAQTTDTSSTRSL